MQNSLSKIARFPIVWKFQHCGGPVRSATNVELIGNSRLSKGLLIGVMLLATAIYQTIKRDHRILPLTNRPPERHALLAPLRPPDLEPAHVAVAPSISTKLGIHMSLKSQYTYIYIYIHTYIYIYIHIYIYIFRYREGSIPWARDPNNNGTQQHPPARLASCFCRVGVR